jgi:putative sporulation protein YyaC
MDKTVYYIDNRHSFAARELSGVLRHCLQLVEHPWEDLVLLCIGTDRITGDSLGPLCGQQLIPLLGSRGYVYGTLSHPVHALNLTDTLTTILARHPSCLLVAIDASLGAERHLGYISAGLGPLLPGAGVRKELPAVGDLFITGIVNQTGLLDRFLLQTTRLATVMALSNTISKGVFYTFCCP